MNTSALPALLGWTVRGRREAMDLSLTEVARRVGVSKSSVSRWELGESMPSIATLYRLAAALNCHPEVLLPAPNLLATTTSSR